MTYKCNCVICGKEFYGRNKNTKYCSHACNKRNPNDIRECKMCGKKFFAFKGDKKENNLFCSHECRNKFPRVTPEIGHCKCCGKEMKIYPYHTNWGRGIYCSVYCQMIGGHCDTDIEKIVKQYLNDKNIKYEYQYHLDNKFYPDFYFPNLNMIIEVQGDYWHGNPEIYNVEDLNQQQIDHMKRDRRKFGYYKSKNIKLYELWGKDIKEDIENTMSVIEEFTQ